MQLCLFDTLLRMAVAAIIPLRHLSVQTSLLIQAPLV